MSARIRTMLGDNIPPWTKDERDELRRFVETRAGGRPGEDDIDAWTEMSFRLGTQRDPMVVMRKYNVLVPSGEGMRRGETHPIILLEAIPRRIPSKKRKGSPQAKATSSQTKEQRLSCNCKKSKCLKLYCECFHALKYCSECNCYDCENRPENDEAREAVIAAIKERNPDAFDSKMKSDASGVKQHNNGCHCKRSACLKKYCECFSLAIPCSIKCRCLRCQNTPSLYQLKDTNASFTAAMFVSAAAASLEDTGEDYLKEAGGGVPGVGGGIGGMNGIVPAITTGKAPLTHNDKAPRSRPRNALQKK